VFHCTWNVRAQKMASQVASGLFLTNARMSASPVAGSQNPSPFSIARIVPMATPLSAASWAGVQERARRSAVSARLMGSMAAHGSTSSSVVLSGSMANGTPQQGPQTQIVVPGQGWVDVASRVVVQVGFPVVVAGVLLWFLLTRFQDNMTLITERMAANTDVAAKLIESETLVMKELQLQTGELASQTASLKEIAANSKVLLAIQEERQRFLKDKP